MTLLEVIQEFCRRTGLTVPVGAVSSSDDQVLQYVGLLNEILEDLEERKAYTFLQRAVYFSASGVEDQGELEDIAYSFHSFCSQYLYNRTTNEVICGPISPDAWQAKASGLYTISKTRYRIQRSKLFLSPAPAVGDQISFEYRVSRPVLDETVVPTVTKPYFTLDTDTFLYPDKILIAGLRWTWKREKGIRYVEDFRRYEALVQGMVGRDGNPSPVRLDAPADPIMGIQIPDRSWPV